MPLCIWKNPNAENLQVFLIGVESKKTTIDLRIDVHGFFLRVAFLLPKRGRLAFMVGHKLCQPKNASRIRKWRRTCPASKRISYAYINMHIYICIPRAGCELCFSVSGGGWKQQQLYVDEVQKSLYPRKPWRRRCVFMAPVFQQRNPSKYSGLLDAWGTIVGYKMPKHIRKIIKRFCLDSV